MGHIPGGEKAVLYKAVGANYLSIPKILIVIDFFRHVAKIQLRANVKNKNKYLFFLCLMQYKFLNMDP